MMKKESNTNTILSVAVGLGIYVIAWLTLYFGLHYALVEGYLQSLSLLGALTLGALFYVIASLFTRLGNESFESRLGK